MPFILALVFAICMSSVVILLGWRRTAGEAEMARALGIAPKKRKLDPEKFARQTGTGLRFNQIAFGILVWSVGGFLLGAFMGPFPALLFGLAGGMLYYGTLAEKRQDYRLRQADDILRAVGTMVAMLDSGKGLEDALQYGVRSCSPVGQIVMGDLWERIRGQENSEGRVKVIHGWALRWDHPAVDIVATILIAAHEENVRLLPMLANLSETLTGILDILGRARAASKGAEWQAKFLALFPPAIIAMTAIMTPEAGRIYSATPIYLLPVLLGSGVSYILTTRMIRKGLSLEASLGVQTPAPLDVADRGGVEIDRMGRRKIVPPEPVQDSP